MSRLDTMALNDSGFAFDPMSGESFTLNETAIDIIKFIKEGKDENEVASLISGIYEIDTLSSLTDIMSFVKQLKMFGLVE